MDIDYILQYGLDFILNFGPKLLGAIIVLFVGFWASNFLTRLLVKLMNAREVDASLVSFTKSFIRIALKILVVITVMGMVGIAMTSFIAILGAAGLAVGFALQGSLSNFASGVMLIIFRPIKVGDFIEGGGMSGSVTEIGIFVTILTTPDNKVIYVPNAKLTSDNIVNYSANNTRRVDLTFGIGYSDDIDKAKKVIGYVLYSNSKILTDPAPTVQVNELADSSVNFVVRPWVKSDDYWTVYWELTEAMKKKFDENKIEIPYPQRDVHLHQN